MNNRENHHPDCCCEYNPVSDKIEEVVLASNCCPVHNYNPDECRAEPVCKCRENENKTTPEL